MVKRIFASLLLVVTLCFSGRAWADDAPSLDRFTEIAKRIAREFAPDAPDAQAIEAIEIVLKAGIEAAKRDPHLEDRGLEAALKPYVEAVAIAAKGQEEYSLAYNRLIVHIARRGDAKGNAVLTVTYGPVSRIALFEQPTGRRFATPAALQWMLPWDTRPVYCPDGTLLLSSHYIHELGYRTRYRISLLAPSATGYALRTDWKKTATLEYGGATLDGDKLNLVSIDVPDAFFTTSSDTTFERNQTFRIAKGRASLLHDEKKQPELRFLHDWMLEARRARKPNAMQKRFRTLSWEAELLEGVKITHTRTDRTTVRVDLYDHRFTFQIRGKKGNWRVLSLTTYDRNQDKRLR